MRPSSSSATVDEADGDGAKLDLGDDGEGVEVEVEEDGGD